MKCNKCGKEFPEEEIEESHIVPTYLFQGFTRKERKNQADKFGREHLCKKCHDEYENKILRILFLNLLGRKLEENYLENREVKRKYFPKIWRLSDKKKEIGIKICLKLREDKNGNPWNKFFFFKRIY